MCGIIGYIDYSGISIDKDVFEHMTDILAYRGPDDKGINIFHTIPFVAFGHRRLSIIDLSPGGHQPMSNDDETIWIIYNGELYNFLELRKDLERRGYIFKSNSDTEVIIYAYEQWGEECLNRFNGMFAFAIWDVRQKKLFAARDHLGIKPFYYYHKEQFLIFSSEIKAILASKKVSTQADLEAIYNPWHYQTSPKTGFINIFKLMPGHSINFTNKGLMIKKYWDIKVCEKNPGEMQSVDKLLGLLKNSVKLQNIADVPVGAFLSGGLDSSCVVALMYYLTDLPVRTFTIKFSESDNKFEAMSDDSYYAKKVANLFRCNHHEIVISPDIVDLLPKIIWHLDEPLADPAAINTYLISKAARDAGVIVLLNGMGGDEIFGGYRKQLACLLADQYQKYLPDFLSEIIKFIANRLPVADSKRSLKYLRWAKHFSSFVSQSQALRFILSEMSFISPERYEKIFLNHESIPFWSLKVVRDRIKFFNNNNLSYLTKMCLSDTKTFLPDHNLTYLDKASMAASVESRPPLIDYRIVEFMFSLHPRYRIKGKTQKYLFKKTMKPILPKKIINRPKAPFGAPLRSWIRGGLREMIDDLINSNSFKNRGIYNSNAVRDIIKNDREGKQDNAHLIWRILSKEIWFRTFIDGSIE